MALIVQKFGGTSLGNMQRIAHVMQIIRTAREQGHDVVVVVSAMGGETDRLIALAQQAGSDYDLASREYDALLATGEQISAALLSMALIANNCPARSFNAQQARIYTTHHHKKARIRDIDTTPLLESLNQNVVPVVTGFQGIDENGQVTTIGRGGSDTTAVMLAAALKADECQIYTDVDGIYTSDPRVVKDARLLSQISFAAMLELSRLGAKVLQPAAVELAKQHQVSVRILSSFFNKNDGTLIIDGEDINNKSLISGIAFDRNQARLTICKLPNNKQDCINLILQAIDREMIKFDMVVPHFPYSSSHFNFSFTVSLDDYKQAMNISHTIIKGLTTTHIIGDEQIAKLSLVGLGMKDHAGVAFKVFQSLGEKGINVQLITSSALKVSTVIDKKHLELGARTLHAAFALDKSC